MTEARMSTNRIRALAIVAAACAAGVLVNQVGGWLGWVLAIATAAAIGGVARWWQRR